MVGLLLLSPVADAVTADLTPAVINPSPAAPTPTTNVVPQAPPLPDLQSALSRPMGAAPIVVPQAQIPRPNLGGDEDRAEQNGQTIDRAVKILRSAKGAPRATINGRPNPRYQEQFNSFVGGPSQEVSTKDMSGELSPYNLTKDPKTASELAGTDCGKNSNNRLVCMVCNIMFEAGKEPKEGQLAVGQNVMTRVFSQNYPDTVCKNVYKVDKGVAQYSWVLEKKDHRLPSGDKLAQVFQAAVESMRKGPNGYTNYYAPSGMKPPNRVPDWAKGGNCAATLKWIGSQRFCAINAQPMRSTTEVARAEGLTMRSDGGGGGYGGDSGGSTISR